MRKGIQDMHRLQELVRLHRQGVLAGERARLLTLSRKTERRYRRRIDKAGLLEGHPDTLPSMEQLRAAVVRAPAQPLAHESSSVDRWAQDIEDKAKAGNGPTAIHAWLRENRAGFEGSLSAVKRFCQRLHKQGVLKPQDVDIPIVTQPGWDAQVDFGYVGMLPDPMTGEVRKAWVFVMVLGHSRLMFARVVFSQDQATWLDLHHRAFEALGGVPQVLVPDNLKAAVIRAAFKADELCVLNRAYREQARHYGFRIDPTPAYQPEKKGKVESGVKYVKNAFFKPREGELGDLDEANRRLDAWVRDVANQRVHGTTKEVPADAFIQREKDALLGLPDTPYVPVLWHRATVRRDCHVPFEKRLYSVPWALVGQDAWLRVRGNAVTVFVNDERQADHRRDGDGLWSTQTAHLPEGRRDFAQRDPAHWYARADALGADVGEYARAVMQSDEVLLPLRRLQSIVRKLEQVPVERAQATVRRAARHGCYRPDAITRILDKGLDHRAPETTLVSPEWATAPRFARQAEEFLTRFGGQDGHC